MSNQISTTKINIKALYNYLQVIITDQYVDINKKLGWNFTKKVAGTLLHYSYKQKQKIIHYF